ncbi:MAG: hypothetical protein AAFQ64_07455 [Pseudomonadota bacterium]
MRNTFPLVLILCAACAGPQTVTGDPQAAAALRAQPAAQYAATVALAQTVANRCDIYRFNVALGQVVDAQRVAQGTGLATARTQVSAVELETDIATRNLLARYEVAELAGPDVCAVAAGEVARQSALGALLVRN